MKKLVLSMVVAMVAAAAAHAQSSLLATLSHDGNISIYYGANALKEAVAASEAGDVITLSSGQFNAVDITKPITLRGAGMSVSTDSLNLREATIIQNAFSINIEDSLSRQLLLEGLYMKEDITYIGTLRNAQFLKCRMQRFIAANYAGLKNTTFVHCRIADGFTVNATSSASFVNSIICNPKSRGLLGNISFDNCFVRFYSNSTNYSSSVERVDNAYYKNCIIQHYSMTGAIPSSCIAYNCAGLGSGLFDNMTSGNRSNRIVSSSIFKTYPSRGVISDADTFELTETAATTYLGTDGTQVGVYGGNLPYDENPVMPQITKCNVASKSTADGKLSVDIEVQAAKY